MITQDKPADFAERIDTLNAVIKRALLDGDDTSSFRASLKLLEAERDRAAASEAQAQSQAEAERIAATAGGLVAKADARLSARLAALAPPPTPTIR